MEIQGTAEKNAFSEAQFLAHAGPRARRHDGAVRGAAQGGRRGVMAPQARRGARLVLASHNPGKLAELGDCCARTDRGRLRRRARPAGTGGDAPDFAGNARIKALAAAHGERSAGVGRQFRLLRRRAGRRAGRLFGPLGRPGEGFRHGDGAGEPAKSAMRRTGGPGSSPRCASPGRTATPRRSSAASTARPSGRRAATRASATIRCSFRPDRGDVRGDGQRGEARGQSSRAGVRPDDPGMPTCRYRTGRTACRGCPPRRRCR